MAATPAARCQALRFAGTGREGCPRRVWFPRVVAGLGFEQLRGAAKFVCGWGGHVRRCNVAASLRADPELGVNESTPADSRGGLGRRWSLVGQSGSSIDMNISTRSVLA